MDQSQQKQMGNTYYRLLPQAKPIRRRLPLQMTSVFQFDSPSPEPTYPENLQSQPLQNVYAMRKEKQYLHEIGQSMKELFKNPVYKMHSRISMEDNDNFGINTTPITENTKIQVDESVTDDKSGLIFNSRFQSGNLALAASSKSQDKAYNLVLHKDLNSKEYSSTQWFYFSVKNNNSLGVYTFNIINYVKPFSAFQSGGMKLCVYSVKSKHNWTRGGSSIQYRKNTLLKKDGKHLYSLSFSYEFIQKSDEVYFAYCYPYTQTKMFNFLDKMEKKYPGILHRKAITKSLGGNPVEMVSITNQNTRSKKVIFISVRVHPGQTVSSYVCEGLIQFLLGNSKQAEKLRTQYIIRIFPMLNPDGVVNGNYRTSLSGDDLNRQWKDPDRVKHPEIFAVKKMIQEIPYEKLLFIDLHGHSRKKSCFMYGCFDRNTPYVSRQFPYILSRKCSSFNYYNCNFATPKYKEGTSRITIWKECNLIYSYTLQTSFCSATRSKVHFSMKDFKKIGEELCENISLYFCKRNESEKQIQVNNILGMFYNNEDLMDVGENDSEGSSTDEDKPKDSAESSDHSLLHKLRPNRAKNNQLEEKNSTAYIPPSAKKRWFSFHKKQLQKTFKEEQPQPIMKHRNYGENLKIHHLQLDPQTRSSFQLQQRKYFQDPEICFKLENVIPHSKRKSSQELYDIFNPSVAFKPNTTRHLERTADYSAVLFPKVVKNQYKKYQRYRKQEAEFKSVQSIYGRDKSPKSTNVNIYMKQIGESSQLSNYGSKQISLLDKLTGKKSVQNINDRYNKYKPEDPMKLNYSIDHGYAKRIRSKNFKDHE